ncbi:MAG TPA: hypothetical protein VIM69_04555 [Opitutaceae bacterium]
MKLISLHATPALLGLIALTSGAKANLIANGDFEENGGSLDGWSLSGSSDAITPYHFAAGNSTTVASMGAPGDLGFLSQTFSTEVGATYDLSFRFEADNRAIEEFDVLFGVPTSFGLTPGLTSYNGMQDVLTMGGPLHNEIYDLANPNTWQPYHFILTATSAQSELVFGDRNGPSFDYLDDVSLTLRAPANPGGPSAVPEPSTYGWLSAAALLSLVGLRRASSKKVLAISS